MRNPRNLKAHPLSVSLARFGSACAVCAALLSAARGATLYWDGDGSALGNSIAGAGIGGIGSWDTVTPNWWNSGSMQAWSNAAFDTAVFGGTAGVVTLTDPGVTVRNLVFNTSGYTLAGAAPTTALTFGNTAPTINLNNRLGAAVDATISAKLSGSNGLTFNGNGGTLTLNHAGTHTLTGALNLHSGTVVVKGVSSVLNSGLGLTFKGTSTFTYDNEGASTATTQNLGVLNLQSGEGEIRINRVADQTTTLAFSSHTRAAGATALFSTAGFTNVLGVNSDFTIGGIAVDTFMPGMFARANTGASDGTTGFAIYDSSSASIRPISYNIDANVHQQGPAAAIPGAQANKHILLNGAVSAQTTITIASLAIPSANNLTISGGNTLTVSTASGAGGILKTGGNASTISGGTLTAGGAQELVIRPDTSADILTISSAIANTTGAITKTGAGLLILNGTNSSTGTTYVNDGTLRIVNSGALGGGAGLVLNGGSYEYLNDGDNTATPQTLATGKNVTVNGTTRITAGRATAGAAANKTITFGTLSIGNQVLTADPSSTGIYTLRFDGAVSFVDSLAPTFNVTGTQGAAATPALSLAGVVSGSAGLIKRGSGTLLLSNSGNTFGGADSTIEIQAGLLSIPNAGALGNVNTPVVLNTDTTAEGLLVTGGAGVLIDPARKLILAGGASSIETSGAGTNLEWAGVISSQSAGTLVKRGDGTLTLSNAASTFGAGGAVTLDVTAGDLALTSTGALGNAANTLNLATTGKVTFAVPNLTGLSFGQTVNLASISNTFEVTDGTASGGAVTLSGQLTSGVTSTNLTKTGIGNLALTNSANTFGGPLGGTLEIQGGSLTVTSGGALGSPTNTVKLTQNGTTEKFIADGSSVARQKFVLSQPAASNANFEVTSGNTFTIGGDITSTAAVNFVKTGLGALILGSSGSTFGGVGRTINIQGGILGAADNGALGNVANSVTLNALGAGEGFRAMGTFSTSRTFILQQASNTIDVDQGNVLTLNSAFSLGAASNALVKTGLGTLTLATAQSGWSGPITINSGAIRVAAANALGDTGASPNTTINGSGGLELATTTLGESITLNTPGDGTTMAGPSLGGVIRNVSGSNNYSGTLTVNGLVTDGTTRSIVIGSDLSSTLTLTGGIAFNHTATSGTMNLVLAGDSAGENTLAGTVTVINPGTVAPTIVKAGPGQPVSKWVISPSVDPVISGVVIRGGLLQVNAGSGAGGGPGGDGVVLPTVPLSYEGTGTFSYSNVGTASVKNQSIGAVSFSVGEGTLQINRATSTVNANLSLASVARSAGATGVFSVIGSGSAFTSTTKMAIPSIVSSGFIDVGLFATPGTAPATSSFAWYDTTAATVRAINYTGDTALGTATSVGGASVLTAAKEHWQLTGADSGQATVTISSLNLQGTGSVALASNAVLTISRGGGAGGLLKTGGTSSTISGAGTATITSGGVGNELVVRTEAAGDILTISVPISNTGALTKSGLGTLTLSGANSWSGVTSINGGTLTVQGTSALSGAASLVLGGGTLNIQFDGDGRSSLEAPYSTNKDLSVTANSGVTVGKLTGTAQSMNKRVSFGALSLAGVTLTTTTASADKYGVEFTGATNLTDALPATFKVVTGGSLQQSNVIQGLTLSGVVSSANPVGFVKSDLGTLVLGNSGNTFGGVGAQINILGGFVAAGSNGALGNLGNDIVLNTSTGGLRAIGTFATDRNISLNTVSNTIEVTQGEVLTLNQPLNIAAAANALAKNDNGILELAADNPAAWNGAVTISGGAIRMKTGGGLGAATRALTISSSGTALQLSGSGVSYNPYGFTFVGSGLNSGGALENVSGNNTWLGLITITGDTSVGASDGSLTLAGSIALTPGTETRTVTSTGAGELILNANTVGVRTILNKIGAGTTTIAGAQANYAENVTVTDGTFRIVGSGALLGASSGKVVTVNGGAKLQVDDRVGAPAAARLGGRAVALNAGTFEFNGSTTANSTQTVGNLTFGAGGSKLIVEAGAGRTNAVTFSRITLNSGDTSIAVTGSNLGSPTNRILSPTVDGLTNAIFPRVTVNGADFGTYASAQNDLNASTTVGLDEVTLTQGNTAQLVVGQAISGNPNIPANARIASIVNGTIFRISVPAIGTATSIDTDFAEGGLAAFAGYERSLDINAAAVAATETYLINEFTTAVPLTASKTINALKMDAMNTAGRTLTGNPLTALTLSSGGLLATGGVNTITTPILSFGAQALIHVNSGASLTIGSSLSGTAGLVKAGAGTLTLNPPPSAVAGLGGNTALTGTYNINEGMLKLGTTSGSANNIIAPGVALRVGPGGTLDLNGNLQFVGAMLTPSAVAGTGGAQGQITSSAGNGTLVANLDNNARNWSANITGSVALSRSGQNTLSIFSPQTYSGVTQITGGATVLRDAGALQNTSALDVNFSTLSADNAGGNGDAGNRISDSAAVTLRGGAISLVGRPLTESSETTGALTLANGLSTLTVNSSGGAANAGVTSAQLTFASLTRQAGSLVNFVGQINGTASSLGQIGNNPRIAFTSQPTLTNNLIGPWAIITGASSVPEFASHAAGLGVGALGTSGFAPYDNLVSIATATAGQNVRLTVAGAVTTATATINSLNISGTASPGITFSAAGNTLNLVSGGLIRSGATGAHTIGTAGAAGQITSGGTNAGTSELVIYQGNSTQTLSLFSKIIDNGTVGARTTLVLGGTGTISLAAQTSNTHTGGTTINGISVNTTGALAGLTIFPNATTPANGLIISGATVTLGQAGQLGNTNIVTLNGPSTLNLGANYTIAGLVFNNTGGTANPTVNGFVNNTASSVLSIGSSGVTATSSNIATTSTLGGRVDLGSSGTTPFNIGAILFDGREISPSQATFALQGVVNPSGGGASGLVKTGAGALQFNGQAIYTGNTQVNAGGIQFGATNAGSRFSTVTLGSASARINLNGASTTLGGLAGSGIVTNASNTDATLTVGFNNASTAFSGQILGISDGNANSIFLTKIGTGTMTFTGASDSTGDLSVRGGTVSYSGAGSSSFTNNLVLTGGTLTLSNATGNVNNRLGGGGSTAVGTLTMNGGSFNLIGNSGTATTETIRTLNVSTGASVITLTPNAAQPLTLRIGTSFGGVSQGGTLLIRGISSTSANGAAVVDGGAPAINFNVPAGAGNGFPQSQRPIRPDMIGDASPTGTGTGFLTKDPSTGLLRLLEANFGNPSTELENAMPSGSTTPTNYELSTTQSITENTSAYSIVLKTGASILSVTPASFGNYSANGTIFTQTVRSGGILSTTGATNTIDVGLLQSQTNVPLYFHANGNINMIGDLGNLNGGFTKSGAGTLTLNSRGLYTGQTVVNAGNVTLTGPLTSNNIAVIPGATTPAVSQVAINGGTFNLNGKSQVFGALASNNPNAGTGGTLTSSTAATVTFASGTTATFGGVIAGALSVVNSGNNTLTLTTAQTYTGTTTLRGSTLNLRDSASLATSSIALNYGSLILDQTNLNPSGNLNPTRFAQTVPITLQGGTLGFSAGGSMDGTATIGVGSGVTLQGGANTINSSVAANAGSTSTFTIGNLVRSPGNFSSVNFTSTNGTLGAAGINHPHIVLNQFNGGALSLTNNIIGAWAVTNSNTWATLKGAGPYEIGDLGGTGQGFPNFESTNLTTATSTQNVNDAASRTIAASSTVNTLRASTTNVAPITLTLNAPLTLGAGGLLTNLSGSTVIVDVTTPTTYTITGAGGLTSGTNELYTFVNGNALTINTPISGASLSLIKGGSGSLVLSSVNSYGGSTVVNQGTLILSTPSTNPANATPIPGDLLINNATTTLTQSDQLRSTAQVTLDGSSTLNMNGSNLIARLVFNNRGGNSNPVVNTSASLELSSANAISVTNDTFSSTPVIQGSALKLTNAAPVITTSGLSVNQLTINSPIHTVGGATEYHSGNGPLTKAGVGAVAFNPTLGAQSSTTSTGGPETPDIITGLASTFTPSLRIGMAVTGTGIPAGSTITEIFPSGTSVRISNNATATGTNNLTYFGSTFDSGFSLSSGSLILGQSSTLNPAGTGVASGPIGRGTLSLADGVALMSDNGAIRTLHNDVQVNGNFTFGTIAGSSSTVLANGGVVLAGSVSFTPGAHSIDVNSVLNTSTISGPISAASASLTKTGPGTLVLSNSGNSFNGLLTVAGGVLRNGALGAVPNGMNVAVNTGAVFDVAGNQTVLNDISGGGVIANSAAFASTLYVGGTTTTDTTTNTNSVFAGSISGVADTFAAFSLVKVGAGVLALSGENTYRGSTEVNSGTLRLTSTGLMRIGSQLNVNGGGTFDLAGLVEASGGGSIVVDGTIGTPGQAVFSGQGNVAADVEVNEDGVLYPKVGPGNTRMTLAQDQTIFMNDGSTLLYTASASNVNRIFIGLDGDVSLESFGTWTLKLQADGSFDPRGMEFVLFDGDENSFSGLNGNFNGDDSVGNVSIDFGNTGWSLDPGLGPNAGVHYDFTGNDIVLRGIVPEPSSSLLLMGGLALGCGLNRMRRRRAV